MKKVLIYDDNHYREAFVDDDCIHAQNQETGQYFHATGKYVDGMEVFMDDSLTERKGE